MPGSAGVQQRENGIEQRESWRESPRKSATDCWSRFFTMRLPPSACWTGRQAVNGSGKLCARPPLHTEAEPVPVFLFDQSLPHEFDDW